MGFSESQITDIISRDPWILKYSLENRSIPSLYLLNDLLGSNVEVVKLLNNCSWFLSKDQEKTLVPNIKLLTSCGVPIEQIRKFIFSFPRFFLTNPQTMGRLVEKTEKLGVGRHSKMFILVIRTIASMTEETWELKLQAFRNLGFSDEDMFSMFKRAPLVFLSSVEKIKMIKDILLATGKYDLSCILINPMSLALSIEKRYKPRLQVLQILDSMNLIDEWPSLSVIHLYTDEKFYKKFVESFSNEIGKVHMAKWKSAASSKKKTRPSP